MPANYPANLPWPLDDVDVVNHFPEFRHTGTYNVLFTDGHVVSMKTSQLTTALFYAW